MKAHILCIDDNSSRLMGHRKTLEDAGFAVLGASDEMQAVQLLTTQRVDVVCVDYRFLRVGGTGISASVKSAKPHVPIVLMRDKGAIPASFREHVDGTEGPGFDAGTQWMNGELQGVQSPFFLQWLDDWKRRASESTNDVSLCVS